jgi:hypothetical protein
MKAKIRQIFEENDGRNEVVENQASSKFQIVTFLGLL